LVGFDELHTFSFTHYNKTIRNIIIDGVTEYFLQAGGTLRAGTSTVLVGISWTVIKKGKLGIAQALIDTKNNHQFVLGMI
jgi:hypothetical protein